MSEGQVTVRHSTGTCAITITDSDTGATLREKIRAELAVRGDIQLHFPGMMRLPDDERVMRHYPGGRVTVNIDTPMADLDDEQEESATRPPGHTERHHFNVSDNEATDTAKNNNFIAGLQDSRRPVKAIVVGNKASNQATLNNGIFDASSFAKFLDVSSSRGQLEESNPGPVGA